MPRSIAKLSAAVFASCALASAATAEEVEHPAYKSWARHPVGTSVTLRSVTTTQGVTNVTTNTTTLVKLTESEAVLETVMTSDATGRVVETPAQTYVQRRMFPLFAGVKKEDVGKPPGSSTHGEETVKLAGKEYKATWFDSNGRVEAGATSSRTWLSEDVPGRLLKAVTRVPKADNVTTVELIGIKTP